MPVAPRHAGIYLHWPYCERKCPYCDFASQATPNPPISRYVAAVCAEFTARCHELDGYELVSVYFGGGTPSLMPPESIGDIIDHIRQTRSVSNAEITVEVNPSSALPGFLSSLRSAGANRLSIGIQSTQDAILGFLGRPHNGRDSILAIEAAREAGFDNLSADFILASRPSSLQLLEADLRAILRYSPEHISAYCLTIETDTPFGVRSATGESLTLDEDAALAQLHFARSTLVQAGYEHYEISNFALAGRRAVHNSLYWSGAPYLGLGPAAHSYRIQEDGLHTRRENTRDPESYLHQMRYGEDPVSFVETLGETERAIECVMTALRRAEGLGMQEFRERTGQDFRCLFGQITSDLVARGLCEWWPSPYEASGLRLTDCGRDLSDTVFLEFSQAMS